MAFVLLTGATDGIGLKSAEEFAKLGIDLIIHGRSKTKLENIKERLLSLNPSVKVLTLKADFSNLSETKDTFECIKSEKIHTLINNAGCFDSKGVITKDGFGLSYQVNHLAHFLITHILLDTLIKNAPSKIIIVSSMAHASSVNFEKIEKKEFSYSHEGYSCSKLCNILFAFKMARLLKHRNVSVNCLHPGVINTKLLIEGWSACGLDLSSAHKMIMYAYNLQNSVSGEYLKDFEIARATLFAYEIKNQDICYKIGLKHLEGYLNGTKANP
ncbi:SDR family NAD(P)-dependent oxidoreductase [Hippea alviniae]|uniref:SDR family NAD(P)-dependent oxidoreductase n=1 Tax=Hippea alviniae TaxID=1279027 RepID=UPI0003B70E2B|nr:SDR family NAD(P)-dependent oxidoreductase [Hippea alviniae]